VEHVSNTWCRDNIFWLVNTAAAGLERSRGNMESAAKFAADAENHQHNHWECNLRHWNNRENGPLCGSCIGGFPCALTPCPRIHPLNYPAIQRTDQRAPVAHGGAARPGSPAGQSVRSSGSRNTGSFVPKIKIMLCKSALADEYGVEHPAGEARCTGTTASGRPCNFAHSLLDQMSTPSQREFIKRYESGTLNVQVIMDEIIKVMTSCAPSEQQVIFEANDVTRFPSYDRAFAKDWLMMWSKAASTSRRMRPRMIESFYQNEGKLKKMMADFEENPQDESSNRDIIHLKSSLANLESKIRNTNLLPLFDGIDSMDEEIVWEMTRLFKICFSSYPMEEVKLGGKNNLCFSGLREEDNTADARYRLQQEINRLNEKRELVKKDKTQKDKLQELNEEIKVATRRLDTMSLIPICQGGAWCKYGVHVSNVQSNGTLFVIDSDNFNGRSTNNIADIVEKRAALKKSINSLISERAYKLSVLEENASGVNRHDVQSRVNEISTRLSELRGEYMNMFNRILLFPSGSTELVIRPYIADVKVSTEAILLDMESFCGLPKGTPIDKTVRDWYMSVYVFREKILNKRKKSANALMVRAIQNFLSLREKKFRTIANAAPEEAVVLYRELIKNQHYITIVGKLSTIKKRQTTFNGRRVFFVSDDNSDKNIYETNNYGVLRPCPTGTGLTTPALDELVSKFDHNQFKTYYGSGAFTVMSFNAFNTVKFMQEAWSYFPQSTDSWNIFIEKVISSNEEFESLGLIQEKIPQEISESSFDDLPYILVERRVYCPEREKYGEDPWAFFFKMPLAKNPKIVGEDSKLALEQPDLFNEFMSANTVITFSAWLLAEASYVPEDKDDSFDKWLTKYPRRKQIRDAYLAYKSGAFSTYKWSTIFTYINFVCTCDSKITIQYFSDNEFFTKKWIASPASKKGITLETFLTLPTEYLEYYQHDFASFGSKYLFTFEQFLKDRKEGWTLVRPKKMKRNMCTSLAWVSGELLEIMSKDVTKGQLWTIKDLVELDIQPTQFLSFSKGDQQFLVPRSICDDTLYAIARAMKPLNAPLLKSLLDKLPTTLAEANMRLDSMISEFRVDIACKKEFALQNFHDLVAKDFTMEELLDLNEDVVSLIQSYISSSKKRRQESLTTAFTTLMRISSINVDEVADKMRSMLTTDICATFGEKDGSMIELKTPTLIAIARAALANDVSSNKPIVPKTMKRKVIDDDDSDDEIIIGGAHINVPGLNSFHNEDEESDDDEEESDDEEEESDDEEEESDKEMNDVFFSSEALLDGPKASDLQLAARFPLSVNKAYYINRVNITKERGTKTSQSYWAIGPFATLSETKPLASAIRKELKTSGITTNKFSKDDHQDTFEVLIPDKGMKMDKRTKKRNLGSETSSAMEQGVLDEISGLLPVVLNTLGVTSAAIHAPNILVEEDNDELFA
jgi:hypothetical protein